MIIFFYFPFFFLLLSSQVQETNPTTGSLEIISVTEDEPPVPQIQFTFKRFFFIPQARVDPSADGSGRDNPQPFAIPMATVCQSSHTGEGETRPSSPRCEVCQLSDVMTSCVDLHTQAFFTARLFTQKQNVSPRFSDTFLNGLFEILPTWRLVH